MLYEHLNKITDSSNAVISRTIETNREGLGKVTLVDSDLGTFVSKITGPERAQFEVARENLARAIYFAAAGFYSQAFSSLRLCLELSFAGVYFSANEYKRRRWVSDKEDFSWSNTLAPEKGVFSTEFVNEFYAELSDEARRYADDALSIYRDCSQFIHGKEVATKKISKELTFQEDVLTEWSDSALRAGNAILFLLLVRYGKEIGVYGDQALVDVIQKKFGKIRAVRNGLGME
ncbi:hypothetical protein ACTXLS_05800 [Corynebacterium variabile]|uniref:hypothetical protein n=1 Tax=Corynebacterium variabile TaxID=1727 RepID=UPI003FCFD95F